MENGKELSVQNTDLSVQLNSTAIASLKAQREQLRSFITSQLRKDNDFGIIPGTPKNSLYKPGAEKIANLFQLGSRILKQDRDVDVKNNFAMFSVLVEVFHIPTGKSISQCEGICNSREKKYHMRSVYEFNQKTKRREKIGEEETPVGDLLNTLSKMAQKRAYVGAVILATGASDFFTQDLEDDDSGVLTKQGANTAPRAQPEPQSSVAPKTGEQGNPGEYIVKFGKNKDLAIRDIPAEALRADLAYWQSIEQRDKKPLKGSAREFVDAVTAYLGV